MNTSARMGTAKRGLSGILGWLLASLLAALVLAELGVLACRPSPDRCWYDAALLDSARRVVAGGSLYPDPHDSLLPPATPYGPAMPLVVAAVHALTPQWTDVAPLVLGAFAVVAMAASLALLAHRLGAGWLEAVAGTMVVLAILVPDWEFRMFLELGPDIVVLASMFLMMALIDSLRVRPGGWGRLGALGLLAFLACLTKQSGLVISGGLFLFVWAMGRSGRRASGPQEAVSSAPKSSGKEGPRGTRWPLAGAIVLGVGAAVGVLAVWPGAMLHTVVAMGRHPLRPVAEWAPTSIDYLARVLWPLVVLGVAGLAAAARRRPVSFGLVLAAALPLAVVQVLSRYKAGGTESNWIAPTLALVPIGLAALTCDVRRPFRRALLMVAMVLVALPLASDLHRLVRELPAQRAAFARKTAFLAERFSGTRVFASGRHYRIIHRAGMSLETDSSVVLHYRVARIRAVGVDRAVASRKYDVVILEGNGRTLDRRLLQLIHANYREVPLPPSAPFDTILVPRQHGEDDAPPRK